MKFTCQHCDQVLSVSSRKAGKRGKCPKCGEKITVPSVEEAAEMMARRKRELPPEADSDPFAQFEVYEETELVYETEPEFGESNTVRRVDREKLAVPRVALYVQGISIGVVALVSFGLGMAVGFFSAPDKGQVALEPKPCTISGQVEFNSGNNQNQPEFGAVVFVLPVGEKMEERIPIDGLRPQDPDPGRQHPAVRAVLELGGNYGRTDRQGEFSLRVPDVGDYYVLVVSNRTRRGGQQLSKTHLAQMSGYLPGYDLIGGNQYHWQSERLARDRRLRPIVFE